jgi:hypothetical protein
MECRAIAGLAPLLHPGAVIVFGEQHGTVESPLFVGDAVCAATRAGIPVVLGLEIPTSEQAGIAQFLASPGSAADREALTRGAFWNRAQQDGRSSVAMEALLDRVRALRARGAAADVVAFDVATGLRARERDRAMADTLIAVAIRSRQHVLIALTGNLHAILRGGMPMDSTVEPMATRLAARIPDRGVVSLDMSHEGGEAWQCRGATPGSTDPPCRQYSLMPRGTAPAWSVVLTPIAGGRYSGAWGVGRATMARPVAR